ncbi:hypothetical protein AB0M57_04335 [Streptomyces sp. NPDC051597]|uniref:hypothetical protein n=1 Tax=Streptomyces sp. NPDC051597 TaxID=3155049 RepID=UPI00342518F0
MRAEIRRLNALLEHAADEKERLVLDKATESELRAAAELRCESIAGLLEAREQQLAAARTRYDHVWGQVKTCPPKPYPPRVTVLNAGIPVVLPVKAVKPRMDLPRWAPKAETVAETTQPIPLAARERPTSWGTKRQDSEATQELPRVDEPQPAA